MPAVAVNRSNAEHAGVPAREIEVLPVRRPHRRRIDAVMRDAGDGTPLNIGHMDVRTNALDGSGPRDPQPIPRKNRNAAGLLEGQGLKWDAVSHVPSDSRQAGRVVDRWHVEQRSG